MISLAEVAKEVYLRIDQDKDSGIPALTKSGVYDIVKSVFDICSQAMVAGESISISKFGIFEAFVRDARKGRNPHSGEKIDIPEKLAVKFKPSSVLRVKLAEADVSEIKTSKPKSDKKKKKKTGKKKK